MTTQLRRSESLSDPVGSTSGHACATIDMDLGIEQSAQVDAPRGLSVHDRRRHVRQSGQQVIAIPLLSDGRPDRTRMMRGVLLDLSQAGIGLELQIPSSLQLDTDGQITPVAGSDSRWNALVSAGLIAGMPTLQARLEYVAVEVRNIEPIGSDRVRIGGVLGGPAEALLRPENLRPQYSADSMSFSLAVSEEVLSSWSELGVLQNHTWDKIQLCPQCHGLPTFRYGCRQCGSARIINDRLIHHFACAHVGFIQDFELSGELRCPKCSVRQLIVGADYEYLTGPFRCPDCHWTDTEREHVAQCLRCGLRFPAHQAFELELRGYRAHRLDPLALLPAC